LSQHPQKNNKEIAFSEMRQGEMTSPFRTFQKLFFLDSQFGELSGDAVHVSSALRGQFAPSISVLLHQRHLLESLQDPPGNGLGGSHEVTRSRAISLSGAIDFGERSDAGRGTDVEMARDRGGAHEEPVGVMGSLLVEARQFDEVGPLWDLHLPGLLQEVGESDDELLLINVFHARHF